jgi:hypothetical protein
MGELHALLAAVNGGDSLNRLTDGVRRRSEQLQLDCDAGHQSEKDAGGDQPHGGLTAVCFARLKPASSERRSRLCDAPHSRDYAERTVMRSWRSPMKGPAIFCGVMLYIILPFGWFP